MTKTRRLLGRGTALLATVVLAEAAVVRLGRTYGSTCTERRLRLPGDEIVPRADAVTDHAVTIDAPPECVRPWLVQMGWHRGGWYTARWVDRLLFPANWPSPSRIEARFQDLRVGDFPDGPLETGCGFTVEHLEPRRALVLHSTNHLPPAWRERRRTTLDWSWAFVLRPLDGGRRTRFHFRSRWSTTPWWLTLGGRLAVVPADLVMSRDMLHGVKQRAEAHARAQRAGSPSAVTTGTVMR